MLLAGCYQETFVVFPRLEVQLEGSSGAALADTPLYAFSWSNPHSRLDAETTYRSDATGHISAPERLGSKTTAPLLLHGVSYPYLSFCVAAPGYRTLVGTLEDLTPGELVTLTLPLRLGESLAVCEDFRRVYVESLGSDARRDDIAAQSGKLRGVYEVTD